MAKYFSVASTILKVAVYLLLLTINLQCANSARIMVEGDNTPDVGELAFAEGPTSDDDDMDVTVVDADGPAASELVTTASGGAASAKDAPGPPNVAAAGSATVANDDHTHPLTFFMHDIVGGSTPSTRMVTGIVASSGVNGQLPFSKPNGGVFPVSGGVPLLNGGNNGIINNNNLPFLTGLGNSGTSSNTVYQNSGNNNAVSSGNRLPFVSGGQLPSGSTLQKLMFGSITVVDDELTEGHELGSSVVGKVQGFYLASSQDGSSQTMALTALLHGTGGEADHHDYDTISLFGIHRTAAPLSHIAIVGGTGKYDNAKGYATIETLHQVDQHTSDGVETVLQVSVYLTP
ncbi:Dirigent protein [Thalictrum thalictroides]|uniref:Dirigent protein n=1 Tax=Thalictrum thalictroides TaxID=46969 RepID=A0A7J6XCF4_THATH|nr:Dirigent protein [Thalictrum thalictroides]